MKLFLLICSAVRALKPFAVRIKWLFQRSRRGTKTSLNMSWELLPYDFKSLDDSVNDHQDHQRRELPKEPKHD